jgi:hypothetical protein
VVLTWQGLYADPMLHMWSLRLELLAWVTWLGSGEPGWESALPHCRGQALTALQYVPLCPASSAHANEPLAPVAYMPTSGPGTANTSLSSTQIGKN